MDSYLIQSSLPLYILAHLKHSTLLSEIMVAGSTVDDSDNLCLLGVRLNSILPFDHHVNNIVKNCNDHLQAFRHIHASVTDKVVNMTSCSIIGSLTDYCNSLFFNVGQKI